jgi:hypothetical protein
MALQKLLITLGLAASAALLGACASDPASSTVAKPAPAQPAAPANSAATAEGVVASALEKKFQEAARSYKMVERDGKTLYCKREKVMGSTIPTMQCLTETQLRNQVESTEELKRRMNRSGGCVQTGGCSGGG